MNRFFFIILILFLNSCYSRNENIDFTKIEKVSLVNYGNEIIEMNTDSCLSILKKAHKVDGIWKFQKSLLQIRNTDNTLDSIYINPQWNFFNYKNNFYKIDN